MKHYSIIPHCYFCCCCFLFWDRGGPCDSPRQHNTADDTGGIAGKCGPNNGRIGRVRVIVPDGRGRGRFPIPFLECFINFLLQYMTNTVWLFRREMLSWNATVVVRHILVVFVNYTTRRWCYCFVIVNRSVACMFKAEILYRMRLCDGRQNSFVATFLWIFFPHDDDAVRSKYTEPSRTRYFIIDDV